MAQFPVSVVIALAILPRQCAELSPRLLAQAEDAYADLMDAHGVIETIDSGLMNRYGGRDRRAWEHLYAARWKDASALLARIPVGTLSPADKRAIGAMRDSIKELGPAAKSTLKPTAHCADTRDDALAESLYACFDELGNAIEFEGAKLTRVSALELLGRIDTPERRKTLFLAFTPLWKAINGNDQPASPYRREIAKVAEGSNGIAETARAAGTTPAGIEQWLEQILSTWSEVSGTEAIEPWDFRYKNAQADRVLADAIPRESLQPINQRFYRDLGADLETLGVLYDLDPRPGKAPLAYTDFVTRGRMLHSLWQPTIARVSANDAHGGLGVLNELVHENGHAIEYAAIRTRPAFLEVDTLFTEAWADVPSWETFEPAWQRRYLGTAASESDSLRSRYAGVVLDAAWALFEIRMLGAPHSDPNALWTGITNRYLHIVPHPELSWWALRAQLVESPGYMLNYGVGAVLTAEMRRRIRESLGSFDTGNPQWYAWVSERLLRYGTERDTSELMHAFLGRPVSPQALLDDIRRIGPTEPRS